MRLIGRRCGAIFEGRAVMDYYQAWFEFKSGVKDTCFGLYRDFPDAVRREGEEKF